MSKKCLIFHVALSNLVWSLLWLVCPGPEPAVGQTFHQVQISNDADDGYYDAYYGTWTSNGQYGGANLTGWSSSSTQYASGYRFAATGINSGDPIQAAYIEVFSADGNASNATCGGAPCANTTSTFRVVGVAQDDGPAFSGAANNTPLDVPYTTAFTDYTTTGPGDVHGSCQGNNNGQNTCTHIIDVTNIVREITSRSGWTSTSAIRFVLKGLDPAVSNVYAGFEDSSANSSKAAKLIVNPPQPIIVSSGAWGTSANVTYPSSYQVGPFVYQGASTLLLFLGDYYDFYNVVVHQPAVTDSCGNTWRILSGPADWVGYFYYLRSTVYYVQNPASCPTGDTISVVADNQEPIFLHFLAVADADTTQVPSASTITDPGSPALYTTSASTGPVTATNSALLVSWAFGDSDAAHTFTPQSGFTTDVNSTPNYLTTVYENVSSGTYTNTFSISPSDGWQAVIVGVPSSGGGSGSQPPSITSATTASGTLGSSFSYQVTATNSPTSYGATGLPAGLSENTSTGLILGTPTQIGTFSVTLSATNGYGTGTSTLTITIAAAVPAITSLASASGTLGSSFSYQIVATNSPTSYGASSLPNGLSVNTSTGLISGTLLQIGTFNVMLSASNTGGTGTSTLNLTVTGQTTPTITWPMPVAITYGTALSASQLDATSSVQGTFTYNPAQGTVLGAGTHTLSVTFTPNDTNTYTTATQTVQLTVNQAAPTVTWAAPSPITYPAQLTTAQLNATASTTGTFTYNPPVGTVLNPGTQSLSVTFTPSDTTDYTTATQMVQLIVNQPGAPTVTWATPAPIIYGTGLTTAQLNATAQMPGTFAYSPAIGALLNAGTQTLSVTFTPTNTAYPAAVETVQLVVNKASQAISFSLPSNVNLATGSLALTATGGASGSPVTFSVVSGPGSISGNSLIFTGTGAIVVAANQAGSANYLAAAQITQSVTVVSNPILTVVANDATRVYGAANPAFTGSITGAVSGDVFTESFSTAATAMSNVGTYPIVPSAAGTNLAAYSEIIQNGTLTITKAGSTVSLSASTSGGSSPMVTLTATVSPATTGIPTGTVTFFDGAVQLGSATLASGAASFATSSFASGTTHSLTAAYSGDGNFVSSTTPTPVIFGGLDFALAVAGASSATVTAGSPATYQLTATPTSGNYPGTVTFTAAGLPAGATVSFNPSSIASSAGQQTVTATIQTSAATSMNATSAVARRLGQISLAFLLVPFVGMKRMRRRWLNHLLMLIVLLAGAGATTALSGCGAGGITIAHTSQTSNVTITASGGGLQHSVNVTLVVQ